MKKTLFWRLESHWRKEQDPDQFPYKMSRIWIIVPFTPRNTVNFLPLNFVQYLISDILPTLFSNFAAPKKFVLPVPNPYFVSSEVGSVKNEKQ